MAIYTVHSKGEPERDAIFLREGFSPGAFVFTAFWAIWHRMWVAGLVLIVLIAGIDMLGRYFEVPEVAVSAVSIAVNLLFGLEAQELRRRALARRGFDELGLTSGRNLYEAELRFFADWVSPGAVPPPPPVPAFRPPGGSHEPLGLFSTAG
jgi:hypothetical protein